MTHGTACGNCGHDQSEHDPKKRDGSGPLHCFHCDDVAIADGEFDNDWCKCTEYRPTRKTP